MTKLFKFVRSDLFLSLAGGFALGVAGLSVIAPASADVDQAGKAKSVTVEAIGDGAASLAK